MKKIVLMFGCIFFSSVLASGEKIEKVIIDSIRNKTKAIDKYRCFCLMYDKKEDKTDKLNVVRWKEKVRWLEIYNSDDKFLKVYDGKYEYTQGKGLPTSNLYRSDFEYLYQIYGDLAIKVILPPDFRDVFRRFKEESFKYIGARKVNESNWTEYVWFNFDRGRQEFANCRVEIDTKTGLLYKLETERRELIVKEVEINPEIDFKIFDLSKHKYIDSTFYGDKLLSKIKRGEKR